MWAGCSVMQTARRPLSFVSRRCAGPASHGLEAVCCRRRRRRRRRHQSRARGSVAGRSRGGCYLVCRDSRRAANHTPPCSLPYRCRPNSQDAGQRTRRGSGELGPKQRSLSQYRRYIWQCCRTIIAQLPFSLSQARTHPVGLRRRRHLMAT